MAKVLVIDDSSTNRELVVTVLESQGHSMIEAGDGAQGLALARAERPQLVISDVLMPTMDGYEFVRHLRSDPQLAPTEVIFYTAHYLEREARNLAAACGVSRVLTKPCEPADIVRTVECALDHMAPPPQIAPEFDHQHLALVTDQLARKANALEQANARLAALTDLNLQLASELDPHILLKRVCRGARDLIGASYAVLTVSERDRGAPDFTATSGIDAAVAATLQPANADHPVFGRDFARRQSRRCVNAGGDPTAVGLPRGYPAAHSALAAPVTSLSRQHGWICLVDKLGAAEFSVEDERLLSILAAQTGRIYESGSLYAELQRRASQLQFESTDRRRAAEKLFESELRLRQLAENIEDVFFLTNPANSEMLYVSPAYEQIWGRSRASLYEQPTSWLAAVHPEDQASVLADRQRQQATGKLDYQFRIVRPDATVRWIWARGFPIHDETGALYRVAGVAEDITARKHAEEHTRGLNRVHAMLSGINSLIVRVRSRDELLRETCRIAIKLGHLRFAWIGLVDPTRSELRPVATAGDGGEFTLPGTIAIDQPDGLITSAFESGQAIACNRIEAAADSLASRAQMLRSGLHACAALPLARHGLPIGCLALYAAEPNRFDAEEMRLLEELAGDIAFGLDRIEKEERLDHLAYYDALTELANRSLFIERLSQQLLTARRNGNHRPAVVLANVERLRHINDTYGRHAGDRLLQQVAQRLLACIGSANTLGRMEADQFAAIVVNAGNENDVLRTVQRWWSECFGTAFRVEQDELRISARAGIALYPIDGDNAETLLAKAEAALHRGRASGERFVFYAVEMSRRVAEKLALETQLRRALENDEFILHYQPKIDLQSRRVAGVEALMRWQATASQLVAPGKFIPLMEETGMILDVGAWVLRRAILDRADWMAHGLEAPRIAVNLSASQLRAHDFVSSFAGLIEAGSSRGIDVEVTESVIMENVEDCIRKLTALRNLGVAIAVDDFGTGYSSLAYLTKLPVETLKIDRSFVHAMFDDPSAMTLVQTMISLAHSLNLKVVAEGVESEEQAKILHLLRCDQVQGFLFGRPMPAHELVEHLRAPLRL